MMPSLCVITHLERKLPRKVLGRYCLGYRFLRTRKTQNMAKATKPTGTKVERKVLNDADVPWAEPMLLS